QGLGLFSEGGTVARDGDDPAVVVDFDVACLHAPRRPNSKHSQHRHEPNSGHSPFSYSQGWREGDNVVPPACQSSNGPPTLSAASVFASPRRRFATTPTTTASVWPSPAGWRTTERGSAGS